MAKAGTPLWRGRQLRDTEPTVSHRAAEEYPIELASRERLTGGAVGQRKAFFEAMIRTNSDTYITCSGKSPSSPTADMASKSNLKQWRRNFAAGHRDGTDQDYNEVQLTFRMPKHTAGLNEAALLHSHKQTGSERDAAEPQPMSAQWPANSANETIAALQLELEQKEQQCRADAARLQRKSRECENLTRVVMELTQGRSKLVAGRAVQAERLADLQREYERVLRIADLSRALSKENMAKAACAQTQLHSVEEDLGRHKRLVACLKERSGRLKLDNLELGERVRLLERLSLFKYGRESACMLEFTAYKIRETY